MRKDPNQKRKATSFGGKKHWITQTEPICKARPSGALAA